MPEMNGGIVIGFIMTAPLILMALAAGLSFLREEIQDD